MINEKMIYEKFFIFSTILLSFPTILLEFPTIHLYVSRVIVVRTGQKGKLLVGNLQNINESQNGFHLLNRFFFARPEIRAVIRVIRDGRTAFLCLPRGKDCRGAGRLVGQTDRTEMKVCVSESSSGLISSLVRSTSAQFRR